MEEFIQTIGNSSDSILEYVVGSNYIRDIKNGTMENLMANYDSDYNEAMELIDHLSNNGLDMKGGAKIYFFKKNNGIYRAIIDVGGQLWGLGTEYLPTVIKYSPALGTAYHWTKNKYKKDTKDINDKNDTNLDPPNNDDDDDDEDGGGGGGGPGGRLRVNQTEPKAQDIHANELENLINDWENENHPDIEQELDDLIDNWEPRDHHIERRQSYPPPKPPARPIGLDKYLDLRDHVDDIHIHAKLPKEPSNKYIIELDPKHTELKPEPNQPETFPKISDDIWQLPINELKDVYARNNTVEDDEKEIETETGISEERRQEELERIKQANKELERKNRNTTSETKKAIKSAIKHIQD